MEEKVLQVGYHHMKVTPPMGVDIPGYYNVRLSDGIINDLYIRAAAFFDGEKKAIIASVNHSGDSDSTGSVTGNILGAYLGMSAIPQKYLDKLELKDVITEIADDLYNDCQMSEYGSYYDEKWVKKYMDFSYRR